MTIKLIDKLESSIRQVTWPTSSVENCGEVGRGVKNWRSTCGPHGGG